MRSATGAFTSCSRGFPLFLTKSRGFSIGEMTLLATLGYAVQGVCALGFGHASDWWIGPAVPKRGAGAR